jgi:methionyl-tRNA formyltransferase
MPSKIFNLAFLGSDEIALPVLNYLQTGCSSVSISAVLTQPDRRSGRGRKLAPNAIKAWANTNSIPCHSPEKPGADDCDWLKEQKIDILLVMAYGHILKKSFLEVASSGCYNLHASLLPKYRGASPIETAIAQGEKQTGVTLMKVVPRMDAGPIIDSEGVEISEKDNGQNLRNKISKACLPLVERNITSLAKGLSDQKMQDESLATYCRKLNKEDGNLNFSSSANQLVDRIRAFSSWPGCGFFIDGKKIRIGSALSFKNEYVLQPGEIKVDSNRSIFIGTGDGILIPKLLQRPGGKMLETEDFLRGFHFPFDQTLESLPMNSLLRGAQE